MTTQRQSFKKHLQSLGFRVGDFAVELNVSRFVISGWFKDPSPVPHEWREALARMESSRNALLSDKGE